MSQTDKKVTITSSEKLGFIGNLATMLVAGIPILEVIRSLLEDARGGSRKILEALHEDLIQGKQMHTTLARFPRVFDGVTVSVVKAAEEAGTLDVTLKDLKKTIQQEIEFADKVRSALLYPAFIIVVFCMVLALILIVVVPRISEVFSRLGVPLPVPTRILIATSGIILHYPLQMLLGGVTLLVLFVWLYRRNMDGINNIIFSLPLVADLVKLIDVTRFSRSLHLLLSSGLPIITALELCESVVVRRRTAQIISNSRQMIAAGKSLSEGFSAARGYIPGIMVKLMEAGEQTGTLEQSMQEIAEYFDYQVSSTLKTLTALLEPVLLVFVGFIVGALMLSIISPIYGLIGHVGGR